MNGMDITAFIRRKALRMLMTVMAILPLAALVSCNSIVYDYEGDCSVTYRLKFRYDRNLKWADAFANEVTSVHVYAFDKDGVLVWQKAERMDPATAGTYSMLLDMPAGDYRLLAWCGLENDGTHAESFSVPLVHEAGTVHGTAAMHPRPHARRGRRIQRRTPLPPLPRHAGRLAARERGRRQL